MPLPTKPARHVQLNEPKLLLQKAFDEHGAAVAWLAASSCGAHSSTSEHSTPLPEKPALHVHKKEPSALEQVACS